MNRKEILDYARTFIKRRPTEERFWSKVNKKSDDECWPWLACVRNKKEGYGAFWFKGKHHPAPRIAYFLEFGVFEDNLRICHKCDNPSCCNPKHLFLGTHQENNEDKVSKKRHVFGERVNTCKLLEEDIPVIRELRNNGMKAKDIALKYSVTPAHISDICRGLVWKHIK